MSLGINTHPSERLWAWGILIFLSLLAGVVVFQLMAEHNEQSRQITLSTDASHLAAALAPNQLQGKLQVALSQLGASDGVLKQDARGQTPLNSPKTIELLASIGQRFAVPGVFIVGADGMIHSSWNENGAHSSGLNVAFRPYFSTAMAGKSILYATVSIARQDHSLYFAAPITEGLSPLSPAIGVLVARTDTAAITRLLTQAAPRAALISPDGRIFASTDPRWLDAGRSIETPLPFSLNRSRQMLGGQVFLLASAPLDWDDPTGVWRVVLLRPLTAGAETISAFAAATVAALLSLLILSLMLAVRRMFKLRQYTRLMLEQQLEQEARAAASRAQINQISLALQQAESLNDLGRRFLHEVHQHSHSLLGVIYLLEAPQYQTLKLLASFACAPLPPDTWPLETGQIGQAVHDGERHIHTVGAEVHWQIRSGLGATNPAVVVSLPIKLQQRVLGAVEFGFARPPEEELLTALDEWVNLLAVNIEILRRRQDVENQLLIEQALIDAIPYPLFFKGPDTRFLGFNRAYERAFAVDRHSLIGKRVLDLTYLDEAERAAFQQEDERVIAEQSQVIRPIELTYADGKSHPVLYVLSGFSAADGRPAGLLGLLIDRPQDAP